MTTGIRTAANVNTIIAAMRQLELDVNWVGRTATQRCNDIATVVVGELGLFGVHAPTLDVQNLDAQGLNGQFDYTPWTLQINETLAGDIAPAVPADPALDLQRRRQKIARFSDTIAHEARHCEQWFRMCRLIADQLRGKDLLVTAKVVAGKMRIDSRYAADVNEQAIGTAIVYAGLNPLTGVEKSEAEEWFNSVYGSGGTTRALRYESTLNKLNPVQTRIGGVATGAVSNAVQTQTFASYQRGLAEEEDAHALGLTIQTTYLVTYGLAPSPLVTNHAPVAAGIQRY